VAREAISAEVSDYLQKETGTEQYAVLANRVKNLIDKHRAEMRVERHAQRLRRNEEHRERLLEITSDTGTATEKKKGFSNSGARGSASTTGTWSR